jgi:hypothetical protein
MQNNVERKPAPVLTAAKFQNKSSLFTIKTGSQWLKDASLKPVPKPLFDPFWNENEICILFAETNTGKSILAVQIAVLISNRQPVIYFDFELSEKQFERRYSNEFINHYAFSDFFLRAEINPEEADYEEAGFHSLEEYINASIESAIIQYDAKVIVIDNITYLKNETEKAKEALPLMKHLNALKRKYGLSILALAHTPKRNLSLPITRNDLSGSKMLMNFCDSAFAIGESTRDSNLRYLKQIKLRDTVFVHTTDNVLMKQITKDENFLAFTDVHGVQTSHEHEHLKQYCKEDRDNLINQSIQLAATGLSQRDIGNKLGIAPATVNKYLKCSRSHEA